MSLVIGIDASRNRSGGAIDYMIGILSKCPSAQGIRQIHVWSYRELLKKLPDKPWLIKHNPQELEKTILHQLWWQYRILPKELRANCCDVLFSTDAGTVCNYNPMIVLSQDALSYEPGIMSYFGISLARLRLGLLFYIQNRSIKHADGVIFLTKYISELIQISTGRLNNTVVIPHGINHAFRQAIPRKPWSYDSNDPISCIYVSNVAMYKNQWHVVKAISRLRKIGYDINLVLIGGGSGRAQHILNRQIKESDPTGSFVRQIGAVPHAKLPCEVLNSQIFIFASSCETISITLLEGMALGMPIACSNREPMPEVLQDGGIYFDPENSASIAAAIEKIITHAELRIFIAKRAKELSEQYSWARCAAETWDFFITNIRK